MNTVYYYLYLYNLISYVWSMSYINDEINFHLKNYLKNIS
jgi:hypothetical protein